MGRFSAAFEEAVRKRNREDQDEIQCPICFCTMIDVVQNLCCGTNTCRKCMLALNPSQNCPFCRSAFDPVACVPDIKMERKAASEIRPCENHTKGCLFVGDRTARMVHEDEGCDFLDRQVKDLKKQVKHLEASAAEKSLKIQILEKDLKERTDQAKSDAVASCLVNMRAFSDSHKESLERIHHVIGLVERKKYVKDVSVYEIKWTTDGASFEAQFDVGNYNVSYFVRCRNRKNVNAASVRLIHPADPSRDHTTKASHCETIGVWYGDFTVMTIEQFDDFVLNGKLFLGVACGVS